MKNVENINFSIKLSGTYWGEKTPEYSIAVNGKEYVRGFITEKTGVSQTVNFEVEIEEGRNRLEIGFLNKDASTDVVKDANGNIAQDILLNVEGIEIDGIDLDNLRYTKSYYELTKKQVYNGAIVDRIEQCVNLGFVGTYCIEFDSPFYIWLLENL